MTMSDPIADMLTRIRNANTAKHDTVDVPASKMKIAIANILVDEGYIAKYDLVEDGVVKTLHITLKYGEDKNQKIITGLKRISKPGLRVYAGKDELPRVLGGLGIAILSTNQGIVTDKEARKLQEFQDNQGYAKPKQDIKQYVYHAPAVCRQHIPVSIQRHWH